MTRSPGWRAALRIARRDALRARGRSALIVAMIALPILSMSTIDVLARTGELDPDERITRQIGAADARIDLQPDMPIQQSPGSQGWSSPDPQQKAVDPTRDPRPFLPPGTRLLAVTWGDAATIKTAADWRGSSSRTSITATP